jgi:hypothetical protein
MLVFFLKKNISSFYFISKTSIDKIIYLVFHKKKLYFLQFFIVAQQATVITY